jgi:V/A-type H+-transporting ATPase subunit D
MAKVALNKSSMAKERDNLKLYQKILPSLEMKRQQLTAELARSREQLEEIREELERFQKGIADQIPMLANREIDVSNLVTVESVEIGEENVVGVRLPVLKKLQATVSSYSLLGKPPWVDTLVERLAQTVELRLKVQVARQRVRLIEAAERRITQRVNLFDKIMIPGAKQNIKRIQIFLGDAERAAVVRSKLAKRKQQAARQKLVGGGVV